VGFFHLFCRRTGRLFWISLFFSFFYARLQVGPFQPPSSDSMTRPFEVWYQFSLSDEFPNALLFDELRCVKLIFDEVFEPSPGRLSVTNRFFFCESSSFCPPFGFESGSQPPFACFFAPCFFFSIRLVTPMTLRLAPPLSFVYVSLPQ